MKEIQKLEPQPKRVESGVVQFGDDWPGVFIRGDHALGYVGLLRFVMEEISEKEPRRPMVNSLEGLAQLLESCQVSQERDTNRLPGV